MRRFLFVSLLFAITVVTITAQPGSPSITGRTDSLSYAVGFNLGLDLKNNRYSFDTGLITKGFLDAFKGFPPAINSLEIRKLLIDMQSELNGLYAEELNKSVEARKKLNPVFLGENGKKPSIKKTASGLQYSVVVEGKGRIPTKEDKVSVHYKGYFVDGWVFDSSFDRGIPNEFIVKNVIRGWIEALTMMPEGSKWVLFIPPSLGYDSKTKPSNINSDDILIFEVELLKVY